ncbi:MAG: TlpA family protein disulfide reductase, partial [Terriglobia bacterium]
MWSWRKSRFWILDIVIIVLACAFVGAVLAHRHFGQAVKTPTKVSPIGPGSKLAPLQAELKQAKWTLVMAMAVGCPYCEKSALFYRELAQNSGVRAKVRLLAVLPESTSKGRRYLNGLGVPVDDVLQMRLGRLGIVGIPTLALADKTGVVSDVWYGELDTGEQRRVLARLENPGSGGGAWRSYEASASEAAPDKVSMQDLREWGLHGIKFTVVDVQSRAGFATSSTMLSSIVVNPVKFSSAAGA